ncbi:transcriptional regulator, partial [Promicromonospora citrea]|nr:transcriptional regulator [Promicromonospora citrea]
MSDETTRTPAAGPAAPAVQGGDRTAVVPPPGTARVMPPPTAPTRVVAPTGP